MSMFEVLRRFGTLALLVFTGAVLLFLLLHLVRVPLVLIAKVLEITMRRLDGFVAKHASKPPAGPVNQFFHHPTTTREEAINVHA
ncbi:MULTISPECIES: hypothetical protein [Amycolatopsis]|uniref:Uncharacterized protein n=1 Tax=Amycolatopsis thermalba TaxID=944492 RepID=A0ABY4NMN0_9PSEU|nr:MULTISPECIES: hypothetical protein [Amycolatopsis]OXM74579.1 hypothetical protein CF166_04285 [Amycolatopsis sp. KNN50.9b]UQS21759.1 hypothetical protein L1857_02425 [Amycolatopsis thermalba]